MAAITGRFEADFSPFVAAVKSAEVELKGLEMGASRVEKSLGRMTDQFSGRKLIQDAVLMAEAIERIGGASALTEKELADVGAKAAEATAKMRALGMDVPANLQNLAAHAKTTGGAFSFITSQWATMTASFVSGQMVIQAITGAFNLATDAAKAFGTMVLEGSGVADVTENFERLASAAGLVGDTLMGAMREGTQNTVDDLTLMKTANAAMAAGLNLTADELQTVSEGAFALAQATGTDVPTAMATMMESLTTGRAKAIEARFGMVDLKAAEEDYAASLNTTSDHLTEEQKLHADRVAIFDTVSAAVERLGKQEAGLDERVAQAQVQWTNFRNELGASIAQSPVLAEAMDAIGDALAQAFGVDRGELVAEITRKVEDLLVKGLEMSEGLVTAGAGVAKMFIAWTAQMDALKLAVAGIAAAGAWISKDTEGWQLWSGVVKGAWENLTSVGDRYAEVDRIAGKFQTTLQTVKDRVVLARDASRDHGAALDANAAAQDRANTATQAGTAALGLHSRAVAENTGRLTERERVAMQKADEQALEKMRAEAALLAAMDRALNPLNAESQQFNATLLAEVDALTRAGFSVEQIASRYGKATAEIKQMVDANKQAEKAFNATAALITEYNAMLDAQSGTRADKQIADINRWAEHYRQELAKQFADTRENLDMVEAMRVSKINRILGLENELTEGTKRAVDQRAEYERNRYTDMLAHVEDWGVAAVERQRVVAEQAEEAAARFGTAWQGASTNTQGAVDAMATSFVQFGVLVTGATEGAAAAMSRSFMDNGVLVVGAARETVQGIVDAHTEGAQKVVTTWSDAMDAVREGKGVMEGVLESGPGAMTNYGPWGSPGHVAAIQRQFAQGRYFGPAIGRGRSPTGVGQIPVGPDWEAIGITPPAGGYTWGNIGPMSEGGAVDPTRAYLVGEKGPELFVPDVAGSILPNHAAPGGSAPTVGGGGVVINNVFHVNGTGQDVARVVLDELNRQIRVGRKWPAV